MMYVRGCVIRPSRSPPNIRSQRYYPSQPQPETRTIRDTDSLPTRYASEAVTQKQKILQLSTGNLMFSSQARPNVRKRTGLQWSERATDSLHTCYIPYASNTQAVVLGRGGGGAKISSQTSRLLLYHRPCVAPKATSWKK